MKQSILASIMVILSLSLIGCGHDHGSSPRIISTSIISDPGFDGDISLDTLGTTTIATIAQGFQSVFAGIDPHSTTGTEYRAFLDFPLTGAGGVPANAVIDSAFLDIVINTIILQSVDSTIPLRIELVNIQSPQLVASDWDRTLQPALTFTTLTPPISQSDFAGEHISVDVTPLMVVAQRLQLANFQIRIMEDLVPVIPGLIEINDTTVSSVDRGELAPLLKVNYF